MTREVHSCPAQPAAPATRRTILVVDDDRDSVDLLCAILESHGFTALPAHSGAEALRRVAVQIPDLILLDVMMPQMSGLQVLEHLRRGPRTARIPTILITAKRQDDDVIRGYRLGADYYITKPCTASQLLYGLDLILAARRGGAAPSTPSGGASPQRAGGG
jgi:CheY-like chemotaxis protein